MHRSLLLVITLAVDQAANTPLGPLRIGIRHRHIGKAIQVLWALRLYTGLGARQFPDAAKIMTAFKPDNAMALFVKCLGGGQASDAAANDGDVICVRHNGAGFGIGRSELSIAVPMCSDVGM